MGTDEIREKYPWTPDMGEISGFGGAYEKACRDMLYAGLAWLDHRIAPDLKAVTYKGIFGVLEPKSDDAKALSEAVVAGCSDCSGAMHQAVMSACFFIAKNGWDEYATAMRKGNSDAKRT